MPEQSPRVDLSIVIPVACSQPHLHALLRRLISTNRAFLQRVPGEIVLIDSVPNPGTAAALPELRANLPEVAIEYFEMPARGVGAKIREGFERARGRRVLFLVDEALSMYDFIEDAYEVASNGYLGSIPYLESQAPETSSHPLQCVRIAPIMPLTFVLANRDDCLRLMEGLSDHPLNTWHWTLRCWELGLVPAYASRHLSYCPVVKMDLKRPAEYLPFGRTAMEEGRRHFSQTWTPERVERCHATMLAACQAIVRDCQAGLCVVAGPRPGIFIVRMNSSVGLPDWYRVLTSPGEVRREASVALQLWRDGGTRSRVGPVSREPEPMAARWRRRLAALSPGGRAKATRFPPA